MAQLQKTVTIINKLGLHARAATKLAQLSQQFDANIGLQLGDNHADASSVLALLLLAGAQGKQVTVSASGHDAQAALDSICQLFTDKFHEQD
jgi:phosphocarrier protein NPr